jgi:hypothetical protein
MVGLICWAAFVSIVILGRCPRLKMSRAFSAHLLDCIAFLGRCPRLGLNDAPLALECVAPEAGLNRAFGA